MSKPWATVELGCAAKYRKEFIQIDDLDTYKRCRVKLHAQGIVRRDIVSGSEIKTKKQQVCRAGEFLVAEIDAKVGGFGIVPDELDGAIVSSHYFIFQLDDAVLDRGFLNYFIRTQAFRDQVVAQGSTNYAAIRPADVLSYKIPLLPLSEQKKLVSRIDKLAGKLEEAVCLHQQVLSETDSLLFSMAHRNDLDETTKRKLGWTEVFLSEVITQVQDKQLVSPDGIYPNLGIYSFGRGLFEKPAIQGFSTSAPFLYRVRSGQFIYSRLFAFEGAYGIVPDRFEGYFVSSEYPTFTCNTKLIQPEFLLAYFKSQDVWKQVAIGSKGLGDRRQRVQPQQLLNHHFMLPPLEWQVKIRDVLLKVNSVQHIYKETTTRLSTVLPSILAGAFDGPISEVV